MSKWAAGKAIAARHQARAFFFADGHIFHNGLKLFFVDHRPHLGGGIQAITNFERFDACG